MGNIFDTPTQKSVTGNLFDAPDRTTIKGKLPATKYVENYGYKVPTQSGWSLLGDKSLSVLSSVMDVLRTGEYAMGGILAGESPITGIREKMSPSEVLKIRDKETKFWSKKGLAGLAADILLDPTTYLTFGTAGVMKIASKGGQIAITKSGRNLLKEIVAKGASEAAARRTMAKVIRLGGEEAAEKYIGKSGLKFMGQVFIPEHHFRIAGKILNKVPGAGVVGKVGSGIAKAFVPFRDIDMLPAKVGGKGMFTDFLYKPFTSETRVKIFKEVDEIKKAANKAFKEGAEDAGIKITRAVEKEELTGDKILDDIIGTYTKDRKSMLEIEKGLGKKIGEIKGYVRHYLGEGGLKWLGKDNDFFAALPSPLRAKLKAAEPRKLVRVIDEAGKDITWKRLEGELPLAMIKEQKLIPKLEKVFKGRVEKLQELQKRLTAPEVEKAAAPWKDYIAYLKQTLPETAKLFNAIREPLDEATKKHFDDIVEGLINKESKEIALTIKELEEEVLTMHGKEFLKLPISERVVLSRQQKVVKAQKKIMELHNSMIDKIRKIEFFDYLDKKGNFYKRITAKGEYKDALPLPIKEINDHFKEKYNIDNFFEEDFFKAWAKRKVEHIKFANTQKFLDNTKARFGVRIDKATQKFSKIGKDIYADSDGIRWMEGAAPQLKGWLLPQPIVKHLDDTLKFLTNEETMKTFIEKVYDPMLRFWKVNVTGLWPAFHTRNFIGGSFNNWLAGVNMTDYMASEKVLSFGADDVIKTDIGTEYTGKQLWDLFERFGGSQPGMIDVARDIEKEIKIITASSIKKAGIKASEAPRWMMEQVENRLRLPLFINRIKKGYSPAEAMKDVFKFHFDYVPETGLSAFERTYMRRLMPFYRWSRGNVPLQIEMMMRQPGKYAGLEKIRQSLIGDKGEKEMKYLPEWMREMFIAPLPDALKKNIAKSMWVQLDLPLEDINKLPISSSGIREIASLLSPFLKYPIERYTNTNLYFGGDIWNPDVPPELQTRKITDAVKILPEPLRKFLGFREVKYRDWNISNRIAFKKRYEMSAKNLHILMTFLGRYYSTLRGLADEDIPTAWKVSRYVGGVPVRSFDIEEEKQQRDYEQERKAKAMMRWLQQHDKIPYKSELKKRKDRIFD